MTCKDDHQAKQSWEICLCPCYESRLELFELFLAS